MKNYSANIILLAIAVIFMAFKPAYCQETGSFDKIMQFNNEDRTVSFFVPTDYSPEMEYRLMVCLHGMGDNSNNYRNALINSLRWNSFINNTIFVCPDGGNDRNRDFYSPEGDEQFIMNTIDYMRANYNIDPDRIMIQGFSLGGRSALKLGLDNPDLFYAALLNTPAVQGALDALNHPQFNFGFNYQNARKLRIAISQGGNDVFYLPPVTKAYEKLLENSAFVYRQIVPNLAHSVASQSYIQMCMSFIDSPTPYAIDAELREIEIPDRTCSNTIDAACVIRNLGSQKISEIMLNLFVNGEKRDTICNMEFEPYEIKKIIFSDIELSEGFNNFYGELVGVNGEINDAIRANDTLSNKTYKLKTGKPIPFYDGFEEMSNTGNDWLLDESGNLSTWELDNEIAKSGNNSLFVFNTILLFYSRGLTEKLSSPVVNLRTQAYPVLSFDLAHNYHRYEPPVVNQIMEFADTLLIQISTDCGKSFKPIYRKAGAELATAGAPILNPIELQSCFYNPGENGWRKEVIDLKEYEDESNVVFRFDYISGMGGSTNIDNVRIEFDASNVEENIIENNRLSLYPNPAKEETFLSFSTQFPENVSIRIYDGLGNMVFVVESNVVYGNNNIKVNTSHLASGVYYVVVVENGKALFEKFVVQ